MGSSLYFYISAIGYKMNMQQNMMNMMNMMNNFGAPQQTIFDPRRYPPRDKRVLTNQTITQSKIGLYKQFPKYKPLVYTYMDSFVPRFPTSICDVNVFYEHVLDVAEKYTEKGLMITPANGMNPVVLNVVGRDFSGTNLESNEEIRDEIINIRTTFNNSLGTRLPFPLKEDECVYSKSITVIRPKYPMIFLTYPEVYRVALITTSPIKTSKDNLLSDNKMNSTDFLKTLKVIEGVFQCAISNSHPVLILSPFGHEDDNNPIDDIIQIYNFCIFKYSHYFKKILFGIPPHYPKSVFDIYKQKIIIPNDLVFEVDKKYEKEELQHNLLSKGANFEKPVKKHKKKKDQTQLPDEQSGAPQFSKEQMSQFMKMMSMMNNK